MVHPVVRSLGSRERTEAGAALVVVVLLVLALVGLGHGVLLSSLGELSASRAAVRHLLGRAASDAAVSVAMRDRAGAWMDSVPVGAEHEMRPLSLGPAWSAGTAVRLARESWLLAGVGRVRGPAEFRTARLVWALDPVERVRSLGGVLSVAPGAALALAGPVDASMPTRVDPPLQAADCAPWLADLEAHYAAESWRIAAATVDTVSGPGLGLLGFPALLARADVMVSETGTPGPIERFGACALDEPWAWGDPERPWRPCGSHLALRGSPADLGVVGGVGQGVLVVGGDLILSAGARFYGLVVVRGALHVDGGSSLTGAALVSGGVAVAADSRIKGSACWATRALSEQRGTLRHWVRVPGMGPIGPL